MLRKYGIIDWLVLMTTLGILGYYIKVILGFVREMFTQMAIPW